MYLIRNVVRKSTAFGLVLALFTGLAFNSISKVNAQVDHNPKVDFCHADPADTAANGWVPISTSANSLINPQSQDGGQHITEHKADIIPQFTYYTNDQGNWISHLYGGKNLDKIAILNNDCKALTVVDICPNIDDIQTSLPEGFYLDEQGNCLQNVIINSSSPTPTSEPTNPPQGPPGPKVCDAKQPPAPLLLTVTRTSATTVLLKWAPVVPSTYYVISYGTDPNNLQFGVPNTGNTDNFTVGALNPNLNYYFRLLAVNDCMPSDPSAVLAIGNPAVLGASTSKVLGASTDRLADTGSDFETLRAGFGLVVFGLVFATGVKFLHGKEEK